MPLKGAADFFLRNARLSVPMVPGGAAAISGVFAGQLFCANWAKSQLAALL
jgi:hypothetical protein